MQNTPYDLLNVSSDYFYQNDSIMMSVVGIYLVA